MHPASQNNYQKTKRGRAGGKRVNISTSKAPSRDGTQQNVILYSEAHADKARCEFAGVVVQTWYLRTDVHPRTTSGQNYHAVEVPRASTRKVDHIDLALLCICLNLEHGLYCCRLSSKRAQASNSEKKNLSEEYRQLCQRPRKTMFDVLHPK